MVHVWNVCSNQNWEKGLLKNVDEKIKSLRDELFMDFDVETRRVVEIMATIHSIQTHLTDMEQRNQKLATKVPLWIQVSQIPLTNSYG